MRSFFLKLFLAYAIILTTVSLVIVEFLLFTTMIFQKLNNRFNGETKWILKKYERTLQVPRSKE